MPEEELADPRGSDVASAADEPEVVVHRRNSLSLTDKPAPLRAPSAGLAKLQDRTKWPQLPDINVTFKDLGYTTPIPLEQPGIRTLASAFSSTFLPCLKSDKKRQKTDFTLLSGVSGAVQSGSMTLILSPPGHGKSVLLKALSGQMPSDDSQTGSIHINGQEFADTPLNLAQTMAMVGQVDQHLPLLTVKETLQFAASNSQADPALLPDNMKQTAELLERKADLIIDMLGLEECADTIVGDDLIRGISGGQKRRLSIGVALMGNHRGLFGDEITNGLDSAVALGVCESLRSWAQTMGGLVVCALQQPTPEIVAQFDRIILLRQGQMVYHGPVNTIEAYIKSLGLSVPADQDVADFLVAWLADPAQVWRFQKAEMRELATRKGHLSPQEQRRMLCQAENGDCDADSPPVNTRQMVEAYSRSEQYKEALAMAEQAPDKGMNGDNLLQSAFAQQQYGSSHARSLAFHTGQCVRRQALMMKRNKGLIAPRVGQSVFMGFIIGTLYYQLDITEYASRLGLIIFAVTVASFGNMVEVPITDAHKRVVSTQIRSSMYPTGSYILSVILAHFPLAIVESLLLSTITYWLTGFDSDAGRFFFFVLVVVMTNLATSVWFRTLTYLAPNTELAEASAGPSTAMMMLFAGYLITADQVPDYLVWFYWLSPLSWCLRGLGLNEFKAKPYDQPATNFASERAGDVYLRQFEIETDDSWRWYSVIYLASFFVVLACVSGLVLSLRRYPLALGTARLRDDEDFSVKEAKEAAPKEKSSDEDEEVVLDVQLRNRLAELLPVVPATLSWQNIHYTVQVPNPEGKGTQPRKLLTDVSGFTEPGELTALMGASGAGKTTLMDVIAGRKTAGEVEGQILVNGHPKDEDSFGRIMGYVEQTDLHVPYATVHETIAFAAQLRLGREVSAKDREEVVQEVMKLLELSPIADRMVGNRSVPGLAPGQLKKVTIAVELVANPSLLFLDEPTTGLDSRTALNIMMLVKRVALTGRSVLCTIHQPSARIFYLFDRLMLLQTGGVDAYFGPCGNKGEQLIDYFENSPGRPQIPLRLNPADWMLQVINGEATNQPAEEGNQEEEKHAGNDDDDAAKVVDYHVHYRQSKAFADAEERGQELGEPAGKPFSVDGVYAASAGTMFVTVLKRAFASQWRNVAFNGSRGFLMVIMGTVLGATYFDVDTSTEAGLRSNMGVIFMAGLINGILNCAPQLPVVCKERPVYYRERLSKTYNSLSYSLSLGVSDLPFIAVGCFFLLVPMYFMVGLKADAGVFFRYYLVQFLFAICLATWSHLLASLLPNRIVAGILQGVSFSLFVMFSGIFILPSVIPDAWIWMYHLNPTSRMIKALVLTQFECADFDTAPQNCPTIPFVLSPTGSITVHQFASRFVDEDYDQYWTQVGWLALWAFMARVLVCIVLEKVNHQKR